MAHAGVGTWTLPTQAAHECMHQAAPDGPSRARCPITSRFLSHRRTGTGQHNGMRVLRRKQRHTHLDIDSSRSHFALRASRRAGTMPGASMGRRSSSGAVQRLQVQLQALGVLQLQHAVTPKFVSARAAALMRAWSTNGDEFRETKDEVRRSVAPASRLGRRTDVTRHHASRKCSPQSLHTVTNPALYTRPLSAPLKYMRTPLCIFTTGK